MDANLPIKPSKKKRPFAEHEHRGHHGSQVRCRQAKLAWFKAPNLPACPESELETPLMLLPGRRYSHSTAKNRAGRFQQKIQESFAQGAASGPENIEISASLESITQKSSKAQATSDDTPNFERTKRRKTAYNRNTEARRPTHATCFSSET